MSRSFDLAADYQDDVEQVHKAFCDEQYWLARLADSGADESTLDAFTSQAKKLPMGIHPDSVEVTSSGLASHWSTRSATIPREAQDRCLTDLE